MMMKNFFKKNFIAARENPNLKITYYFGKSESTHVEFVVFNYYYKEKIDVEDEKKKVREIRSTEI